MLLSDKAYTEFIDKLCVCFSKDKKKAVITTKEEAEEHKEDIDKYVNTVYGEPAPSFKRALDVKSCKFTEAFYLFIDEYMVLSRYKDKFYIETPKKDRRQLLGDKKGTLYYDANLGYNPLIACIKYYTDTTDDTCFCLAESDWSMLKNGIYPPVSQGYRDLADVLNRIYADSETCPE